METHTSTGPWASPPSTRWDDRWQVRLWAMLRHPSFSRHEARQIAHGLTMSEVRAVWAATSTFQRARPEAAQHAAAAMLRDELLDVVEQMGPRAYDRWTRQLWRGPRRLAASGPRRGRRARRT